MKMHSTTSNFLENLNILKSRMGDSQLKTFKQSYEEKVKFGKLVYSKSLKKKP